MPKFLIEKRLDLSWLGDGWDGCYLSFNPLTFAEISKLSELNIEGAENDLQKSKQLTQAVIELLETRFIKGLGWDGSAKVEIEKDDIKELPMDVITQAIQLLSGQVEKKD